MDEVDSPAVAQDPAQAGNSQPTPGQELSKKPKSDPEQRINGMMRTLGKRTQERDQALAEAQALRQQLDTLVTGGPSQGAEPEQQQPEPQQAQDDVGDVDDDEDATGPVNRNNPSRDFASTAAPRSLQTQRTSLSSQLNAAIHDLLSGD